MTIIFILFFGIVNLVLFSFLTKKIILRKAVLSVCLSFLSIVSIYHLFFYNSGVLNKEEFFRLVIFSGILVISHFMNELAIKGVMRSAQDKNYYVYLEKYLIPFYNVMRNYVVYIFVFGFQVLYLVL